MNLKKEFKELERNYLLSHSKLQFLFYILEGTLNKIMHMYGRVNCLSKQMLNTKHRPYLVCSQYHILDEETKKFCPGENTWCARQV